MDSRNTNGSDERTDCAAKKSDELEPEALKEVLVLSLRRFKSGECTENELMTALGLDSKYGSPSDFFKVFDQIEGAAAYAASALDLEENLRFEQRQCFDKLKRMVFAAQANRIVETYIPWEIEHQKERLALHLGLEAEFNGRNDPSPIKSAICDGNVKQASEVIDWLSTIGREPAGQRRIDTLIAFGAVAIVPITTYALQGMENRLIASLVLLSLAGRGMGNRWRESDYYKQQVYLSLGLESLKQAAGLGTSLQERAVSRNAMQFLAEFREGDLILALYALASAFAACSFAWSACSLIIRR